MTTTEPSCEWDDWCDWSDCRLRNETVDEPDSPGGCMQTRTRDCPCSNCGVRDDMFEMRDCVCQVVPKLDTENSGSGNGNDIVIDDIPVDIPCDDILNCPDSPGSGVVPTVPTFDEQPLGNPLPTNAVTTMGSLEDTVPILTTVVVIPTTPPMSTPCDELEGSEPCDNSEPSGDSDSSGVPEPDCEEVPEAVTEAVPETTDCSDTEPTESSDIDESPDACNWNEWCGWSDCIGGAIPNCIQLRVRKCECPEQCPGDDLETKPCPCPECESDSPPTECSMDTTTFPPVLAPLLTTAAICDCSNPDILPELRTIASCECPLDVTPPMESTDCVDDNCLPTPACDEDVLEPSEPTEPTPICDTDCEDEESSGEPSGDDQPSGDDEPSGDEETSGEPEASGDDIDEPESEEVTTAPMDTDGSADDKDGSGDEVDCPEGVNCLPTPDCAETVVTPSTTLPPCITDDWVDWSTCSVTCTNGTDTGTRSRSRNCDNTDGDCSCPDDIEETQSCPEDISTPCRIFRIILFFLRKKLYLEPSYSQHYFRFL